ncbi:MAG: hypothetical protein JSS66_16545 [Armatimonadetes bacterium]|nr:hypothetical protein [Armatimonadota bacterium]
MPGSATLAIGLGAAIHAAGLTGQPQEHQHHHMPGMDMSGQLSPMDGRLGHWSMAKEGSGTSWMPESSPMFMKHLPKSGGFDLALMGSGSVNFNDAGGPRGESQFFSNSMFMVMAKEQAGKGILGLSAMASLDALFNGKRGYPNLFQTGETDGGMPMRDRQHPHELIAELSATYSLPIAAKTRAFVYGGPVGEPALGGPMFLHRPSGMEIPEAPISHHWFDSTHISFGVLTGGLIFDDKLQLEGSLFNGQEPDENRFDIDPIHLGSASGRATYNPTKDLSFQVSYGFLKDPEALEPGVDQHRLTASAMVNRLLPNNDDLALTAFFGQNIKPDGRSSAFGLEATLYHGSTSFFGRFERVDKDELVAVPPGKYNVNKILLGATKDFASVEGYDFGVGAYVGLYSYPSSLDPFYGKNPVTLGLFIRVRPSKM